MTLVKNLIQEILQRKTWTVKAKKKRDTDLNNLKDS